jgi:hypothetical protein
MRYTSYTCADLITCISTRVVELGFTSIYGIVDSIIALFGLYSCDKPLTEALTLVLEVSSVTV